MEVKEILALLNAGFTKDEILAITGGQKDDAKGKTEGGQDAKGAKDEGPGKNNADHKGQDGPGAVVSDDVGAAITEALAKIVASTDALEKRISTAEDKLNAANIKSLVSAGQPAGDDDILDLTKYLK